MFTGLTLLGWIVGLAFLYTCWRIASELHREPTLEDDAYSAIDEEIAATEAFYTDLKRNCGI